MMTKEIPTSYRNARRMTDREVQAVRAATDLQPTRAWIIWRDAGAVVLGRPSGRAQYEMYRGRDISRSVEGNGGTPA